MTLENLRNTFITLDLEIADTKAQIESKTAKMQLLTKGLRSVYGRRYEVQASKELWETYLEKIIAIKKSLIKNIEKIFSRYSIEDYRIFRRYVIKNQAIEKIAKERKISEEEVKNRLNNLRKELEYGN